MKVKILLPCLLLLSACQQTLNVSEATERSSIGMLVSIEHSELFKAENSKTPTQTLSSHGVVLAEGLGLNNAKAKLLLTDGRIVWGYVSPSSKATAVTLSFKAQDASKTISVTNMPPNMEGDQGFNWLNITNNKNLKITGSTDDKYTFTPSHVAKNGRKIFKNNSFLWPQIIVDNNNLKYWRSLEGLVFYPTENNPTIISGLLHEPFLGLTDEKINADVTDIGLDYIELSEASPKLSFIKNLKKMTLVQTVKLNKTNKHLHNIRSVNLYSGEENCHIFSVNWFDSKRRNFGYCEYSFAGATPVITAIKVIDNGSTLSLSALEVTGDENRAVSYHIRNNKAAEGWLDFQDLGL